MREKWKTYEVGEHEAMHRELFQGAGLVENCLLENNVLLHLSPAPVPSLIHLSFLPKARYIRTFVCARCVHGTLKKVAGPFDGSCSTFEGWIFFRLCRHDKRPPLTKERRGPTFAP